MGIGRVLFVGAAIGNVGLYLYKCRSCNRVFACLDGFLDFFKIIAVFNRDHMPVLAFKFRPHIFCKCDVCRSFNGNGIIIIKADQFSKSKMSCKGNRFKGNPFHQIPVTAHHIGMMTDDFFFFHIESGCQMTFGNGHAHRIGNSLTQWSGGGFNTRGISAFRMSRGSGTPLPEIFQVIKAKAITRQVKKAVKQRRYMASGHNKAVPVNPCRVFRIMF